MKKIINNTIYDGVSFNSLPADSLFTIGKTGRFGERLDNSLVRNA